MQLKKKYLYILVMESNNKFVVGEKYYYDIVLKEDAMIKALLKKK